MDGGLVREFTAPAGLLRVEDCLDADGGIAVPADVTLISLIDRNIANIGASVAYRYVDYARAARGDVVELTWTELGVRLRAIAAVLQRIISRGDRVAVLAPQGIEYVAGFFGAVKAGAVAVPLFAPELPGHAERLDTAMHDAKPAVVLTTAGARTAVAEFLASRSFTPRPQVVVIDRIPDQAGQEFAEVDLAPGDVSHLQYTSGTTRAPVGVEITHRAVGTNLLQMILSIDLLDRNTHGVSWLPLYHDMGLSMIGFPAVYGGHSTLMSPTAFIRRPQRWIELLSAESRHAHVVTAAPNFAYEWTAQRGRPAAGEKVDLCNVVMIIGSEPVSIAAIDSFNRAFAPHGLPPTAIKPSYGIAEATLLVATIEPGAQATALQLDREQLAAGRAVVAEPGSPAVPQVSCGQVARSQWAVIVDPGAGTGDELPDGRIGEIWLQGNNIGRGYWQMPAQTAAAFGARLGTPLADGSHSTGASPDRNWLRTGDLGFYLHGELYVTGRLADLITIDGRRHYPHDLEATTADASELVRRGYVAVFTVPAPADGGGGDRLVVVAERAAGTSRVDPGPAVEAIKAAVLQHHAVPVAEVRILPAGAIPRTTSGKLARRACREQYLDGRLGNHGR